MYAWWLQRGSNPCFRLERATSYPLDDGAKACALLSGSGLVVVGRETLRTPLTGMQMHTGSALAFAFRKEDCKVRHRNTLTLSFFRVNGFIFRWQFLAEDKWHLHKQVRLVASHCHCSHNVHSSPAALP